MFEALLGSGLSLFNHFICWLLKRNKRNQYEKKLEHSKKIIELINIGWNNNIYYNCEFDPDNTFYYRLSEPKEPSIEDISFANDHLKTGYVEIWKTKDGIIEETKILSKKIQQTLDVFKQKIREEFDKNIVNPSTNTNIKLLSKGVNYSPKDTTNVYIERNIINLIFKTLVNGERIEEKDLESNEEIVTIKNSKSFKCWNIWFKGMRGLGYGEKYAMVDIQNRLLKLIEDKEINILINNYLENRNKLNGLLRENNFSISLKRINNDILIKGITIKGTCNMCKTRST